MVFQSFALYPHLTVFDNFAYPLVEAKVSRAEIQSRVRETAAMLRLAGWHHRRATGREMALERVWWTPPLAFQEALAVEARQIRGLGLEPIVSLTDHDDIEAPYSLQVLNECGGIDPLSFRGGNCRERSSAAFG